MLIIDTIPYLLNQYKPSVDFLRSYYSRYPEIFDAYFLYHCKDTEERHKRSLEKYPQSLPSIKQVYEKIIPIIHEVSEEYYCQYGVEFPIEVNLIVGGFGSNAYTYRQIIPNITFCLERLSPNPDHLKVIVAHEFGHVAHNVISDQANMDWSSVKWESPLLSANREGVATHFSRQIAPELHPSIYFSYNDEGHDWLTFANNNVAKIKTAFFKDYGSLTLDALYLEWFSINGGKTFDYNRLAYYLGDLFFQNERIRLGERNALLAWKEADFEDHMKEWLMKRE